MSPSTSIAILILQLTAFLVLDVGVKYNKRKLVPSVEWAEKRHGRRRE